jgi:hypothetical protein
MTPVVAVAGVLVTVAWFRWQCRRAVKVAAPLPPHGRVSGAAGGRVDGSSLPVPTPGELRDPCDNCINGYGWEVTRFRDPGHRYLCFECGREWLELRTTEEA